MSGRTNMPSEEAAEQSPRTPKVTVRRIASDDTMMRVLAHQENGWCPYGFADDGMYTAVSRVYSGEPMDTESTNTPLLSAPLVKVTVSGVGITIEREIPEDQALGVISILMGGDAARGPAAGNTPITGTQLSGVTASLGPGDLTIGEYIESVGARTNSAKIVAIGAFLIDRHGVETFSRNDVKGQFQRAGEPAPGNFTRDFSVAVNKKLLAPAHGASDAFFVTKSGRTALEQNFAGDGGRSGGKSTTRSRSRKKSADSERATD